MAIVKSSILSVFGNQAEKLTNLKLGINSIRNLHFGNCSYPILQSLNKHLHFEAFEQPLTTRVTWHKNEQEEKTFEHTFALQ